MFVCLYYDIKKGDEQLNVVYGTYIYVLQPKPIL